MKKTTSLAFFLCFALFFFFVAAQFSAHAVSAKEASFKTETAFSGSVWSALEQLFAEKKLFSNFDQKVYARLNEERPASAMPYLRAGAFGSLKLKLKKLKSSQPKKSSGGGWTMAPVTQVADLTESPGGAWESGIAQVAAQNFSLPGAHVEIGAAGIGQKDVTVAGNAYNTSATISWNVENAKSCTGSGGFPGGDWWKSGGGILDHTGRSVGSTNPPIVIRAPSRTQYTLSCMGKNDQLYSDSLFITADWTPSMSLTGPPSATASDEITIDWGGNDLKSCTGTRSDTGGSWWPGDSVLQTGNPQGANGSDVLVGTIAEDTTFTFSCTGFDGAALPQKTHFVDFISSPTPYFFIQSIDLIIVGPGSGGRSNTATIGVTPGGGFDKIVTLTASTNEPALLDAGIQFSISPTTVSCNGSSCGTANFWIELSGGIDEGVYDITITADAAGFDQKSQTVPLRVRQFVPAFEEI